MPAAPVPASLTLQGTVNASGDLSIPFGPNGSEKWRVSQVTLEMPDAPAGALAEIRRMGTLLAPAPSPRRATASGEPSILLYGGETLRVEWSSCTPGNVGQVLVIYDREAY